MLILPLFLFGLSIFFRLCASLWFFFSSFFPQSENDLFGLIPSSPFLLSLDYLDFSSNLFSGSLPGNISATSYDVSDNDLSGPLLLSPPAAAGHIVSLNLARQASRNMSCPILLQGMVQLQSLDLHNAGFDGCDFADPTQVALPSGINTLDISYNAWKPMLLRIPPSVQILRAIHCGVTGFDRLPSKLQLQKLYLF